MLSQHEMQRYTRHLPLIALEGQQRLKDAKVLCVGAGGLGSPALQYLAAAGVGVLGIVDDDRIELSNLQRQILFGHEDIGELKAEVAAKRLQQQNDQVDVRVYPERLTLENAEAIVADYDVVIDGTDNYKTRYLINDVCFKLKKPLVSASIFQFQGQCSVFNVDAGPCYRCLYRTPPPEELTPNCAMGGVLGILPGIVGTLQATETIKIILGIGESLSGRLLTFDSLTMRFSEYPVMKDPACPLCSKGELSQDLFNQPSNDDALDVDEVSPKKLSELLQKGEDKIYLIDVREDFEREITHIGGEHIPLFQLNPDALDLPKDSHIVVYCKAGARSLKAAEKLQQSGFTNVYTLAGGILRWGQEVDTNIVAY